MGKTKKVSGNKFLKDRLAKINKVISNLEGEVEKAVSKFMRRGEKSSRVLRDNLDDIIDRISTSELYSRASEKTEDLRRLADDVVTKIKKFDLRVANSLFKDVRGNVDQIVEKLQGLELVEIAKDKAANTRIHVLNALNIPSQEELKQLSRKVSLLERKVKTIGRRRAA